MKTEEGACKTYASFSVRDPGFEARKPRPDKRLAALACVLLAGGCAGLGLKAGDRPARAVDLVLARPATDNVVRGSALAPQNLPGGVSALPCRAGGGACLVRALAAAGDEAEIVEIPSPDRWPRCLRGGGPFYAQVHLSPFVGQLGVLADKDRADSGMGFALAAGWRKPTGGAGAFAIEGIYGESRHHNPTSDVDGTASHLLGAVRLSFGMDRKVIPFAAVGVGSYALEFDKLDPGFNLSGMGAMFAGGVEWAPSRRFSARAELALHIWDAEEEQSGGGGVAETLELALGAAVAF